MMVIPAIDLVQGEVTRLVQGRFDKKITYPKDPIEAARGFVREGAQRIHVIDLEGARDGRPRQAALIERILAEVPSRFQVGGGIRDAETVSHYLGKGAHRVVLGTRVSLDRGFLKEVLESFRGAVIVAIDAAEGRCATEGWTRLSDISVEEMIDRVHEFKGDEILYTDIARDGTLEGVNKEALRRVVALSDLNVIASGGVKSLEDIEKLLALGLEHLIAVIAGRALYEGSFSLKDAVQLTRNRLKK